MLTDEEVHRILASWIREKELWRPFGHEDPPPPLGWVVESREQLWLRPVEARKLLYKAAMVPRQFWQACDRLGLLCRSRTVRNFTLIRVVGGQRQHVIVLWRPKVSAFLYKRSIFYEVG